MHSPVWSTTSPYGINALTAGEVQKIYQSTLSAVPEPSSLLVAGIGGYFLLIASRRHFGK